MKIDMFLSDYDDELKKNMLIDLNFFYSDLLSDDIELNEVVVVECNHHVLHNVILDDVLYCEYDQQNGLNVRVVFVEKYLMLMLSLVERQPMYEFR